MALGGRLPLKQVIRRRVRYLIDGGVFGSAAFVENVFAHHRERFGLKRNNSKGQVNNPVQYFQFNPSGTKNMKIKEFAAK